MRDHYRVFFGFKKEPFSQDIRVEDMMKHAGLMGVKERFLYAVNLGAVAVITGDVGSGKSSGAVCYGHLRNHCGALQADMSCPEHRNQRQFKGHTQQDDKELHHGARG